MPELSDVLKKASSKFATFLKDSKIHPTRVIAKSHELETLRDEDRHIKRAKRLAAGKEDDASKAARTKKPRSGRPVTERLLLAAISGETISGPAKTRLLRAVNALQAAKKQPETELRKLF
jgi:hypothetical protein